MKKLTVRESLAVLFLILLIIAASSFVSWKLGYIGFRFSTSEGEDISDYKRAFSLIENEYLGKFDKSKGMEKSIIGLLQSLGDPYSYYVTKEDYEKYLSQKSDLPSIEYKMVDEKTIYVKISQFGVNIRKEFDEVNEQLTQNSIQNLIIDLRDNTGGFADSEVYIADQFLDSGTIFIGVGKDGKTEHQMASPEASLKDAKVIFLANRNTASSSELLIAALVENDKAQVVGEKTLGKSTEQTFFDLAGGSAIHITTAKWLTPNGNDIEGIGITPNIEILQDESTDKDEVLEKAIEALFSK